MLAPPFQSANHMSAATMQIERSRMHAESVELIAATRRTMARSRALLAEVDAVLAREKLPLVAPQISFFDAG